MGLHKVPGSKSYLADDSGLKDLGTSSAVAAASLVRGAALGRERSGCGPGHLRGSPATVTAGWANSRRAGAVVRESRTGLARHKGRDPAARGRGHESEGQMIDALVFPDTRDALFDLIDGATHLGEPVKAVYQIPAGDYGEIKGPFPVALIYVTGGTRGFLDRVDRATIEVYAPGQAGSQHARIRRCIASSARTSKPRRDTSTASRPDVTPADVPYQSDTLNKAVATFLVTSRPL